MKYFNFLKIRLKVANSTWKYQLLEVAIVHKDIILKIKIKPNYWNFRTLEIEALIQSTQYENMTLMKLEV